MRIDERVTLLLTNMKQIDGGDRRFYFRGYFTFKDNVYKSASDVTFIDIDFLKTNISDFNGFFSMIILQNEELIIAVDKTRSFPIFYRITENGQLIISDQASKLIKNNDRMNDIAMAELLMTCYSSISDTSVREINQLQAGEYLHFKYINGKIIQERSEYFRIKQVTILDKNKGQLIKEAKRCFQKAIERLIKFANGRPIIIPLSGGYDSRLLIMLLKKLGYRNLLAYTYGISGNDESNVSKYVAEKLNVQWLFIEYRPDLWKRWIESELFDEYEEFAWNLSSIPHIQDWPAVNILKEKKLLENGIFVPGHSGDFLGGKQIPLSLMYRKSLSKRSLIRAIWKRHYVNFSLNDVCVLLRLNEIDTRRSLKERIAKYLSDAPILERYQALDSYENEFWKNKLSKFIINSMRVYEFFDYEWWLPFYDSELVLFWKSVPIEWRFNKVLYNEIVETMQLEFGIENKENRVPCWKKYMASLPFFKEAIWLIKWRKLTLDHPLGWIKCFPNNEIDLFLYHPNANINTFLGLKLLIKYYRTLSG